MDAYEKILAFAQVASIIIIWIRFESRISRLEGRFEEFKESVVASLRSIEKRR